MFSRRKKKTISQTSTSHKATFQNRRCYYLGRCAASRPLIGPGVARRLRRGGGHGRDGALVLRNLGLRVPEVEVPRVAVDEPPPRLGQRRIQRRVARALGRRRGRRRRHPQPFSRTLPHSPPTTDQSDQKRHTLDEMQCAREEGAGIESLRGKAGEPYRLARRNARGDVGDCGRSRGGREGAEAIGVFSVTEPSSSLCLRYSRQAGSSRGIKREKGERRRRGQVASVVVSESLRECAVGWGVGDDSWWWDRRDAEGRARQPLPGAQRRWPFFWFRPRPLLAVHLSFLGIPVNSERFGLGLFEPHGDDVHLARSGFFCRLGIHSRGWLLLND